jgi:SAM-dependent methyltransferase
VLDAGSGIGATAVHLARTVGCRVTGVTLERSGVEIGYELARSHGVEDRVAFLEGSITDVELEEGSFDHALMECVLSLIDAKGPVLDRIFRVLRPGGRLGLTDVTVDGELPPEMHGVLAAVGCLRGATSLRCYADLIADAGFVVERSEDRAADAASFLRALRGKLLMVRLVSGLGRLSTKAGLLDEGERLLDLAEEQVRRGTLGYGLFVARKPS